MIQENLKFLQENVKYMGFADATLSDRIAKNMEQGVPEFTLKTSSSFNNKKLEGELYFRKSDNSDMYFFNRYNASLKGEGNNPDRSQTFYIDNGKGITFKEAFNLLEGRAVYKDLTNKEQEKYQAWLQLDFNKTDKHQNFELKRFTEGYGYDLAAAVKAFPVKEFNNEEDTKKLIASLQKGNVQSVTMQKNGTPEKMFIEASPQWKTVNLFDEKMKPLTKEQKQSYMLTRVEAPAEKQRVKQENPQAAKQNNEQRGEGLLQKKRVSHKKGLSVN